MGFQPKSEAHKWQTLMMKRIEDLRELDYAIYQELQKAHTYLPWLLRESKIPKTAELFYIYIGSTDVIKRSLFLSAIHKDIYSVKILFRSIIEHFLRFQYIWFNFVELGQDESFSSEHYVKLALSERLSANKSIAATNRIRKQPGKTIEEMWSDAQNLSPKFAKYSMKEIETFSKEISIKNIIEKLLQTLAIKPNDHKVFIEDLILRYSELSSFVHGGLHAHHNVISYEKSGKLENDLLVISGLALQAASFIKVQSFVVFYGEKREFGSIYYKIQELIKQLTPDATKI